jgi:chitodextrinase
MLFHKRAFAAVTLVLVAAVVVSAASASRGGGPSTPTNLRITATTDTSISLAWDASRGSGNWWYCVSRDSLGCIRVNPPQTTLTITRLLPNTTFNYSVYAVDAQGHRSGHSNTVTYTTPPDVTPPAPAPQLSTTQVYPTRVSLTWTESVDNTSQVYYTLLVDGSPYFGDAIGARAITVFDLSPGSTHVFKIIARDAYNNSVESNVLPVTTPAVTDTEPPSVPTNLRLSSESQAPEIWLDWDQSTDNVDPQSALLYDVYINGQLDHAALGRGDTITYCVAEGPNTIVVRAVDTSGNTSAPSNEIVFDC